MTSRRWLIKLMKQAAKRKNVTFESIRQGGSHEIFQLDGLMIPIPRHNEIDNNLADNRLPHNAITAETRLAPLSRACCASMPENPSISATFPGKWRAKSVRRVAR